MYKPKYFSVSEFKACTPSCKIEDMDSHLLIALDNLRELCGFPIKLNSAYRSVEYEKKHGRPGTSSHCKGLAVDIACTSNYERFCILQYAYGSDTLPVFRIGIGKTYLHLDIDFSKPFSCWVY